MRRFAYQRSWFEMQFFGLRILAYQFQTGGSISSEKYDPVSRFKSINKLETIRLITCAK